MASSQHSEFDQLCARAAAGDLSAAEWERLNEHLSYCEVCEAALQAHRELYAQIGAAFLDPEDGANQSLATGFDLEAGERRLMESLKKKPRKPAPGLLSILVLIFTTALACLATGLAWHERQELARVVRTSAITQPAAAPIKKLSVPPSPTTVAAAQDEVSGELRKQLQQRTLGEQQLKQRVDALEEQIESTGQDRDQLQQQAAAAQERAASLSQQLTAVQSEKSVLQEQLGTATQAAQTHRGSEERELQALRATVDAKDKTIAENEELLSHDRDIRDLMGARNLLIEDIYDVAEDGKRKKTVGRIFYTKDKRLLFYGYDLDKQKGLKQNATFQAWGNNQTGTSVSLGLFDRDDANKRWVLKFNDAATLARLTSVFVTVEPSGGSNQPTGKRLLGTSLRVDANYP